MLKITEKLQMIEQNGVKVINGSGARGLSFCIVNSNGNGHRLTLSKALIKELELDEYIHIVPNVYDSEIILSSVQIGNISSKATLSVDKRYVYSAAMVKMLTEVMNLDFTVKTSLAFTDISFDDYEGNKVAIIKVEPEKCKAPADSEVGSNE